MQRAVEIGRASPANHEGHEGHEENRSTGFFFFVCLVFFVAA